jgi:NADPH-dependent ferric siderophore reductase
VRVLLAGQAQTAQRIRSLLRARGLSRHDATVKAYWTTGKTGL